VEIYSIGYTKRTAEDFFETLRTAGVEQVVDVRLNNTSQLAGFTKKDDLAYFLPALLGGRYVHEPRLAPTPALFNEYKKNKGPWEDYAAGFLELLEERRIERVLSPEFFAPQSALLCSEPAPDRCHGRLVIEYLDRKWGDVTPVHL
jgi:uncharacterized protein (DUF488 family)